MTKKYELCDSPTNSWLPQSYDNWKKIYDDPKFPLTGAFEKRSIMFTLKLATILNNELKNMNSIDELTNKYLWLYFKALNIFLYNWHTDSISFDIKKENLSNCFDNLLLDALQWEKDERQKQN